MIWKVPATAEHYLEITDDGPTLRSSQAAMYGQLRSERRSVSKGSWMDERGLRDDHDGA